MPQFSTGYPQVIHRPRTSFPQVIHRFSTASRAQKTPDVTPKTNSKLSFLKRLATGLFVFGFLFSPVATVIAQDTDSAIKASQSGEKSLDFSKITDQVHKQTQEESVPGFDPEEILSNEDLYSLPDKFSSISKIQAYLEDQGSFLANYKVLIQFEADDDLLNYGRKLPDHLRPGLVMQNYLGKEIPVSELVWLLSRTSFGNGCSVSSSKVCINNNVAAINPAVILALIQKESGLIYGKNSKLDPKSKEAEFLLDRATGYYCMETDNKEGSCYDENPTWRYFKGFFRQTYYATRFLRIMERRCDLGGDYSLTMDGNFFQLGKTINIGDQKLTPKNALSCGFYLYTPHVFAQELMYNVYVQLMK